MWHQLQRQRHKMKGQTLVEVIIVIALVIILVTGIVSGTTTALNQSKDSQIRSKAITLAQEGLEITRYQRDSGWDSFAAMADPPTQYCVGSDRTFQYDTGDCGSNILGTVYSRDITLLLATQAAVPTVLVSVTVGWGADQVTLTNNLLKR